MDSARHWAIARSKGGAWVSSIRWNSNIGRGLLINFLKWLAIDGAIDLKLNENRSNEEAQDGN